MDLGYKAYVVEFRKAFQDPIRLLKLYAAKMAIFNHSLLIYKISRAADFAEEFPGNLPEPWILPGDFQGIFRGVCREFSGKLPGSNMWPGTLFWPM